MKLTHLLCVLFFALTSSMAHADVALAKTISNNMVLQRELAVPIWGTADSGKNVIVRFAGQTK